MTAPTPTPTPTPAPEPTPTHQFPLQPLLDRSRWRDYNFPLDFPKDDRR